MIALIQRVSEASVRVEGEITGRIGAGLLALIGVERDDSETNADRLVERVLTYRVFGDEAGRMNLSLLDSTGGLLLVPQFTLAADTRKGTRASFSSAAAPERARELFDYLVSRNPRALQRRADRRIRRRYGGVAGQSGPGHLSPRCLSESAHQGLLPAGLSSPCWPAAARRRFRRLKAKPDCRPVFAWSAPAHRKSCCRRLR